MEYTTVRSAVEDCLETFDEYLCKEDQLPFPEYLENSNLSTYIKCSPMQTIRGDLWKWAMSKNVLGSATRDMDFRWRDMPLNLEVIIDIIDALNNTVRKGLSQLIFHSFTRFISTHEHPTSGSLSNPSQLLHYIALARFTWVLIRLSHS